MTITSTEAERLDKGVALMRGFSTQEWRAYFSYLLGRPVTLDETDAFLRESFDCIQPTTLRVLQETR